MNTSVAFEACVALLKYFIYSWHGSYLIVSDMVILIHEAAFARGLFIKKGYFTLSR